MNNNRKSADVESLYNWISNTNEQLSHMPMGQVYTLSQSIAQQVRKRIINASNDIQQEYPYYARILLRLEPILFPVYQPITGMVAMNSAVFGELFVIITHIHQEPINEQFWENIHPRIKEVSKDLFCDGHFSAAFEAAIKEVEKRMRELFKQAKPNSPLPKDASQLINALLSETGLYSFCDTSDISGENFHKGTKLIFEGAFTAYRNPSMHTNMHYTQKEAFEQIVQASQMMTILTQGAIKP